MLISVIRPELWRKGIDILFAMIGSANFVGIPRVFYDVFRMKIVESYATELTEVLLVEEMIIVANANSI